MKPKDIKKREMQISQMILRVLFEKGIAQYELAEKTGINRSAITRSLSTGNISTKNLIKIERALDIDIYNVKQ